MCRSRRREADHRAPHGCLVSEQGKLSSFSRNIRAFGPDYPGIPTAATDALARRGSSRSASSTYRCGYACVVLPCEDPPAGFGLSRLATAFLNNPGLGGQGLDVPPLAFGEDRVEGQRGFPGAGHAGDDGHLIVRDLQGDVLEVVLPRAGDDQLVLGGHRLTVDRRNHTRRTPLFF